LKCLTFTKKPGLKIYAGDNKLSISEKTILWGINSKENVDMCKMRYIKLFNANPEVIESRDFNLYSFINTIL
jgi:hypothetical protein